MIQNRLNDKEKDIQGLKKQTSSLLNCAWEKGYIAGFDDGYKTGRQAEQAPKGEWVEHEDERWGGVWHTCSNCHKSALYEQNEYNNWRQKLSDYCPNCGADMRGEA